MVKEPIKNMTSFEMPNFFFKVNQVISGVLKILKKIKAFYKHWTCSEKSLF